MGDLLNWVRCVGDLVAPDVTVVILVFTRFALVGSRRPSRGVNRRF
jgi:hypothetical protein